MVETNRNQTNDKESKNTYKEEHTAASEGKDWSISRRSAVKLIGVAGAAALPISASVAADTHDDYETIEVPAGEREEIRVRNGETLSNKLIDVTASGASVRIDARGSDWTVRNVGVKGEMDADDDMALLVGGERGTVENVYLGDGCIPGRSKGAWVDHGSTDGPIEFRRVHVAGFPNNGIYGSPTADLQGGVLHIRDSYFDSNNISQFKIGSPLGTCEVTNTVVRTDNSAPHNGFDQVNKRGIWALDGDIVVRNCDIQGTINTYAPATVEVEDTRWDGRHYGEGSITGGSSGTPDLSPPESCPTTAEEAASGSTSGSSGESSGTEPSIEDIWNTDDSNHVTLTGETNEISDYRIVGVGNAEFGEDANTDSDDPYRDTVEADGSEFTVRGYLGGAADDYHIRGEVNSVEINGDISVTVNGVQVAPPELEGVGTWDGSETSNDDKGETADSLGNTITIDGTQAPDEMSRYTFSVTGEAEQSEELTSLADERHPWDAMQSIVSDGDVTGIVGNGEDGYRYSGEITSLQIHGNADVNIERTD